LRQECRTSYPFFTRGCPRQRRSACVSALPLLARRLILCQQSRDACHASLPIIESRMCSSSRQTAWQHPIPPRGHLPHEVCGAKVLPRKTPLSVPRSSLTPRLFRSRAHLPLGRKKHDIPVISGCLSDAPTGAGTFFPLHKFVPRFSLDSEKRFVYCIQNFRYGTILLTSYNPLANEISNPLGLLFCLIKHAVRKEKRWLADM